MKLQELSLKLHENAHKHVLQAANTLLHASNGHVPKKTRLFLEHPSVFSFGLQCDIGLHFQLVSPIRCLDAPENLMPTGQQYGSEQ